MTRFCGSLIIARNTDVSDTTVDQKSDGRWSHKLYFVLYLNRSVIYVSL